MTGLCDLTGKVVIVTGAGQGLGAAHARLAAAQGATVVVTDVAREAAAAVAGGLGGGLGDGHLACALDVGDPDAWDRVVAATVAAHGRVDGLVNNAGIWRTAPFDETGIDLFEVHLRVNLMGAVHGTKAVVPHMPPGGSIVNIASIAALSAWRSSTAYTTSKFALRGFSRSAAVDLGERGIRVNCVCPGTSDTPLISDEARAGRGFVATLPVPRVARPEEISAMVVFLLSDAASYCTAQDFVVDGGMKA